MSCILMLVDANLKLLDDAARVVSSLDDRTYSEPTLGGQRVGAQFRHVIEFYESFLDGLDRARRLITTHESGMCPSSRAGQPRWPESSRSQGG